MPTLPLEVHEVLEEEYRAMYDAEPEAIDYGVFEIMEEQGGWARKILTECKIDLCPGEGDAGIQATLKSLVDSPPIERSCPKALGKLTSSPAIGESGLTILANYESYLDQDDGEAGDEEARRRCAKTRRRVHRRIVDEAFCGAVKSLRDMKLEKIYGALHDRARREDDFVEKNPGKAAPADSHSRAALCISGGGIRSATFALGVIQGLASARILHKFDYLSTVSGGGYIGSWLSSWIRRHPNGIAGVEDDLVRADSGAPGQKVKYPESKLDPEPQPLRHLRDFSNFLSPRLGITSIDSWTLAAMYVRNLLLNLLIIVPILACLLAFPRFFTVVLRWAPRVPTDWVLASLTFFLAWAFFYIGMMRPVKQGGGGKRTSENFRFILGCVLPLALASVSLTVFWACNATAPSGVVKGYIFGRWGFGALLATTLLPFIVYYARYWRTAAADRRAGVSRQGLRYVLSKMANEIGAAAVGGGVAAALLVLIAHKVFPDPMREVIDLSRVPPFLRALTNPIPEAQLYVCFAVPLVLLVFYAQASLFVGLSGFFNEDNDREWWGRAGAFLFFFAAVLGAASVIAILGPIYLYRAPVLIGSIGGFSGIAAALFGFSARTPANSKQKEQATKGSSIMDTLAAFAVPLFVVVTLAAVSLGTTWLIQQFRPDIDTARVHFDGQFESQASIVEPERDEAKGKVYQVKRESPRVVVGSLLVARGVAHLKIIEHTRVHEAAALMGIALLAFGLSFLIGVNKFSMHALYRNRLIRAYLGASRYRRDPDRFTGFDENDNVQMFQLQRELAWGTNFTQPAKFVNEILEATGGDRRVSLRDVWKQVETLSGKVPKIAAPLDPKKAAANAVLERLGSARKKLERNIPDPFPENLRDQLILAINAVLLDVELAAPPDFTTTKTGVARNRAIFESIFPSVGTVNQAKAPVHIVNAALNVTSGDNLAWQQRQAESFTISPMHCGSPYLGYRTAREYGGPEGISLGTAVTISGAAASPNQGYHSSPAVAFLLTLLNVRLGWWLGNPGVAGRTWYRRAHPWSNVRLLFKEATGQSNDTYPWVYLSDGGHFENLGLYEMVLRRCRYVVLSDAGCDPKFTFEDLGNAIRKVRTDLGVPIDIRKMYMLPRTPDSAMFPDGRYVAIADIRYSAVDKGGVDGQLVYIKPGLYSEEYFPKDVYNYALSSSDFPHETTADQFFSESQFESYRALGRYVVNEICGNIRPKDSTTNIYGSVRQFVDRVVDKAEKIEATKPEAVVVQGLKELALTIKEGATAAAGARADQTVADRFDRLMIAIRRPRKAP